MLRALVILLAAAAGGAARAQYPSKPITLVVPFTAGSDADVAARNLAQHAAKYLGGEPIVVVNQPGASGAIGTQAVRNAAPDGYTLLLARIASQVILPATDPRTPYKWNEFSYLGLLEVNPYLCAVRRDTPYRSMRDLVEDMRKRPGKLNFATVGTGTLQNFGPQYLFLLTGLPRDAAVPVPYKGSGELAAALAGGQVDFACSNLGALLPHFRAGALRGLMTSNREPLAALPEVPTARSLGWRAMENFSAWSALAGPPSLPGEVVRRWGDALTKLARDPEWRSVNEILGSIPSVRPGPETEKFVLEQYELYEKLAIRLGMRI